MKLSIQKTMKLYLVRHGESIHNASGLHQYPHTELSPDGIKQAKILAKRFTSIPIDIILSSDYERAKQTAQIINKLIKKEIIYTPLLGELKRPSEIQGKEKRDPEAMKIKELMREHWPDPFWHYSDEENFFDLKERAVKFLDFLSALKEENILVVTHGMTVRIIVSLLGFGNDLTPETLDHFESFYHLTNTGITLCQKDEKGRWKLITWNDHAHLG